MIPQILTIIYMSPREVVMKFTQTHSIIKNRNVDWAGLICVEKKTPTPWCWPYQPQHITTPMAAIHFPPEKHHRIFCVKAPSKFPLLPAKHGQIRERLPGGTSTFTCLLLGRMGALHRSKPLTVLAYTLGYTPVAMYLVSGILKISIDFTRGLIVTPRD